MKSRDFAYWLQGFFEIQEAGCASMDLSPAQVECIRAHLNMVFKHEIDPSHGDAEQQKALSEVHKQVKPGVLYDPPWPKFPYDTAVVNC